MLGQISAVLSGYDIDYVKWDHNRDIIDAGSGPRAGAPAAHAQTQAVYDLLDELRARHPGVEWESCAGGGGRIDLGVLERVQRIWTSDMTDALARQVIQRWTGQLVPPEYLGAHVAAPFSHQTGRLHAAVAARRHRAVRALRHGVGHHPAARRGPGRADRVDRAVQAAPRADPLRPGTPGRHAGRHRLAARRGRGGRLGRADELRPARAPAARPPGRAPPAWAGLARAGPAWPGAARARSGPRYLVTDVTPGERASPWPGRRGGSMPSGIEVPGAVLAGVGLDLPVLRPLTAAVLHLEAL